MSNINIKVIAKMLDVSPSTVSRALSGKPGVSINLRNKIKKVAKNKGYIKNLSAQILKNKKSNTIGVIVFDIKNPFYLNFLNGIESVLFHRNYKIILGNINEDVTREKVYLNWFVEHNVDGILTSPTVFDNDKTNLSLYRDIYKLGLPIVFYDRIFENEPQYDYVVVDNKDAIITVIHYLKELGHDNIGIFLSKKGIYTIEERLKGFIEGCKNFNINIKKEWICEDIYPPEKAFEKLNELLITNNLPTAIITTNNNITKKIYLYAKELNIKIPEQLSVIGFDDFPENEIFTPPVTSIRQPIFDIGRIATSILLGKIDGTANSLSKIILKSELIIRGSVFSKAHNNDIAKQNI
jgi:LacI family transcriptional regulator